MTPKLKKNYHLSRKSEELHNLTEDKGSTCLINYTYMSCITLGDKKKSEKCTKKKNEEALISA